MLDLNNELYKRAINLPPPLASHYYFDRERLNKEGFVVNKILLDDYLPNTPIETGFLSNNAIPESVTNLIAYLNALELYPVVYEGENDGHLIRHVVPRLGFEKQISSYGSSETFYPHVDNPDLRMRGEKDLSTSPIPHTLTLLCLRQQKGVATSIVRLVDILADLSQDDIELLSLPHFTVRRPASFQGNNLVK